MALRSTRRLAMTGTVFQNNFNSLASICKLLRLYGPGAKYNTPSFWYV